MAFIHKYKTFFEVRVIHSYLLEDPDYFWSLNTLGAQAEELEKIGYDIAQNLHFELSADSIQKMNDHKLVFKKTLTGFKVGIQIIEREISGVTKSFPVVPIEKDFRLAVKIKIRNSYFNNISNIQLKSNLSGSYYLSNLSEDLSYPSLHPKILTHNQNRKYEMGEVSVNATTYYRAKKNTGNTPGTNDWDIATNRYYLSVQDSVLVPTRFAYILTPVSTIPLVTHAKAILENTSGQVAEIEELDATGLKSIQLDFRGILPGAYILKIIDQNTLSLLDSRKIYLDPEIYDPADWGVIEIGYKNNLTDFRLVELSDGSLRTNGGQLETPVFDIRIDSRITIWKYIPSQGQVLTPHPSSDIDSNLHSKAPTSVSRFYKPMLFKENGTNNNIALPNPGKPYIHSSSGDLYYSIIHLPELNI